MVDAEIKLLLLMHVISRAELKADSFVSSIFATMKPDGSRRTILNLKLKTWNELLFTKLLKQPFGFLRKHGYASVVYIDDSYLQGDTYAQCSENIHATRNLLVSLGFSINHDKSVLQPAQHIVFLGFVLDSLNMSICLSDTREGVILAICKNLNSGASHKIRLQSVALLQLSLESNMVVYSTATWKDVKILL